MNILVDTKKVLLIKYFESPHRHGVYRLRSTDQ